MCDSELEREREREREKGGGRRWGGEERQLKHCKQKAFPPK